MSRSLAENITRGRCAIQLARGRGLDTSQWERHLADLLRSAGLEPFLEEGFEPWMLWEWRRVSIPEWRTILEESIEQGDTRREKYARWMLRDVLLDPDHDDPLG